jgi:hypothetical protein
MNRIAALFRKFCVLVFVLTGLLACANAQKPAAQAGWAEVDITPPLGIALGGRGGNYTKAGKILDPLYAQVLFLKDAKGAGFALVTFDLIGLPHDLSDKIRLDLVHELGVNWNLTLLNCSHTHSGPNMTRDLMAGVEPTPPIETEYFKALREKIISAARNAKRNLDESKIEIFDGKTQIAINRRGKNKQGNRAIIPDPSGPIDDNLWVMKITPENGNPPAVIFSCACHPVIVYGFENAAISADFPGLTRKNLRQELGEKAHLQFVQGFAGNVRPRACAYLENLTFTQGGPAALQKTGADLAHDVLAALKNKAEMLHLDLAAASDRPFLPRDNPPSRQSYEKMLAEAKNENSRRVAEYWLERYNSGEGFARGDAWPAGLIRLAENQWIVYLAGEPVVEWRAKFTQWLPGKKFVPFGYAQESITYLPTEKLLREGGYEVVECNRARASSPAPFAPGIEKSVEESFRRQRAFIDSANH